MGMQANARRRMPCAQNPQFSGIQACQDVCSWPLALVFVPVWLGNLFLSGENLLWNPIAIALAWPEGLAQLFAYSASLCTGAVFTLGLCLYWYVRWPSPLYAILLFFAATMASPAWVVVARLWHALGAQPVG